MVLAATASVCHEDPDNKQNDISDLVGDLRSLTLGEEGLTCSTSDKFLVRFLKASKNDLDLSHLLIKEYFKAKIENPDIYLVKSPAKNIHYLKRYDLGYVLKGFDNFGRRIFYVRLGNLDPGKESYLGIFHMMVMITEAYSFEEDVQDNGLAMILDVTNFTLKIMKWATPHKLRTLMRILQDCIPVRFEAIHIVNAPLVFNIFYATLKPFMNEEFKRKINWHNGNCKTLDEHIEKSVLPSSLGGTTEIEDIKDWFQLVLDKEDNFAELRTMGYKSPAFCS